MTPRALACVACPQGRVALPEAFSLWAAGELLLHRVVAHLWDRARARGQARAARWYGWSFLAPVQACTAPCQQTPYLNLLRRINRRIMVSLGLWPFPTPVIS